MPGYLGSVPCRSRNQREGAADQQRRRAGAALHLLPRQPQICRNHPDTAKQVVDELSQLSDWANAHQDDAAGILATSTGLDKAIWLKALARLPYGAERMTPAVYNEQQALADTFTRIGLLPVKVDVPQRHRSQDK